MPLPQPPGSIFAFYAIDIALGGLAVVSSVTRSSLGLPPSDLFRIGTESNLPTWYASSQLLLIGILLSPLAFRDVRFRRARTWPIPLLPAFFVLLSLDEAAKLHERVGWVLSNNYHIGVDLITGPWMYAMTPFYGLLAWLTYRTARPYLRGRSNLVILVLAGGVLFAFSAVGLEYAANLVDAEALLAGQALSVFEEVGEMMAATTLLWSVVLLLSAEQISLSFSGIEKDRMEE